MPKASVKIMRSYDYNHFEVCLSTDEDLTLAQVDELRKEAARLTDKAVEQYKTARAVEDRKLNCRYEHDRLSREVSSFKDVPESEWTEEMRAKAKKLSDVNYWMNREYDYEDDFDFHESSDI